MTFPAGSMNNVVVCLRDVAAVKIQTGIQKKRVNHVTRKCSKWLTSLPLVSTAVVSEMDTGCHPDVTAPATACSSNCRLSAGDMGLSPTGIG